MNSSDPHAAAPEPTNSGMALKLTLLAVLLSAGLAGVGVARWMRASRASAADKPEAPTAPLKLPAGLFSGWRKPDLAIVLSGSQHGYLLPCGCSRPQVGGLERRYNLVQLLREKGWPVAAFDVGDVPQMRGPVGLPNQQGLLKYKYSMRALDLIGYSAVSFGEYEAGPGLLTTLAEYSLNHRKPRVLAANLKNREEEYPDMVGDWELVKTPGSPLKVGVTAAIGPTILERIRQRDNRVDVLPTIPALDAVLGKMDKGGVDFRVLLYQGLPNGSRPGADPTEAAAAARKYPQFQVILCVNDEDEPASQPLQVGNTLICGLGHKGKYVGVVGVWRTRDRDRPYQLAYQLVSMSEDFLTPADLENDHPISRLLEEYTQELKRDDYLARYGQSLHPLQALAPVPNLRGNSDLPTYIGSEKCKKCHEDAYEVWKTSDHSHAYETLTTATRPSLRQFDAECIVCHTVGFSYKSGFESAAKSPHLKGVGCESCHGPGSIHAANPNNAEWQLRMNPWKPAENETTDARAARLLRVDQFCQKCHDIDNDVTWTNKGFEKKWPKIAHPSPQNQ